MNTFKKIFAVVSAAAALGVMTLASINVSAAGLDPSETAPYTISMAIQAGSEQLWDPTGDGNHVEISADGSYSTSYTFTTGSATIEALIIDSSINLYSFAPEGTTDVAADTSIDFKVDNIKIVRVDGSEEAIAYNGPSAGAFRAGDNGSCMRLNILNEWTEPKITDISTDFPGGGVNEGDKIVVDWTISGLSASDGETGDTTTTTGDDSNGTTTTTTTNKSSSSSSSSSSKSSSSSNSSTSKVSETADAGVVAIVVGAAAAASLAAGALTIRRKRK